MHVPKGRALVTGVPLLPVFRLTHLMNRFCCFKPWPGRITEQAAEGAKVDACDPNG